MLLLLLLLQKHPCVACAKCSTYVLKSACQISPVDPNPDKKRKENKSHITCTVRPDAHPLEFMCNRSKKEAQSQLLCDPSGNFHRVTFPQHRARQERERVLSECKPRKWMDGHVERTSRHATRSRGLVLSFPPMEGSQRLFYSFFQFFGKKGSSNTESL